MTKEEYIQKKQQQGHVMHQANGVWWERTRKGYCKPAVLYDAIPPKEAHPGIAASFLGLNHRLPSDQGATGFWKPFMMRGEALRDWSLDTLESGNRRRRIRKGLKGNTVEKLEALEPHKEAFKRILKSTAIRNGHGHPPEYYDDDSTGWWSTILRVAHYTEFWAAFQNGKMAGYICLHVMGERVVVDGVKSDTEMLPDCPMDAIIFHFLTDLQQRGGIEEIWYGGKSNRPTLDAFKESYGFKVEYIPFKTSLLGGYLPYPKWVDRWVKRGDDEQ